MNESTALVQSANQLKETLSDKQNYLIKNAPIVNIGGQYDHTELLLDAMELEYESSSVSLPPLHKDQVLIINCAAGHTTVNKDQLREFVEAGGWLITTDWCLSTIIEETFPDTIQKTQGFSHVPDDCVVIEPVNPDHPITKGILPDTEFWLETGSYMIQVLDERAVSPIIVSQEMGGKYGSDLVLVGFGWGDGKVFHSTSHFELQKSKSGDTRIQDQYSSLIVLTNILSQKGLQNLK